MIGDGDGEWFELYNASGRDLDLEGMVVRDDGSNTFTVSGTLMVAAGGYVVFGNNADISANGGVAVQYDYGGSMSLANGDDELYLENAMGTIDAILWDGGPIWPDPDGASMNLDPAYRNATDNDDGANWCEATSSYDVDNLGTPGAGNDPCLNDSAGTAADTGP